MLKDEGPITTEICKFHSDPTIIAVCQKQCEPCGEKVDCHKEGKEPEEILRNI